MCEAAVKISLKNLHVDLRKRESAVWRGQYKVWFCLQNGGSFVCASNLLRESLGAVFLVLTGMQQSQSPSWTLSGQKRHSHVGAVKLPVQSRMLKLKWNVNTPSFHIWFGRASCLCIFYILPANQHISAQAKASELPLNTFLPLTLKVG